MYEKIKLSDLDLNAVQAAVGNVRALRTPAAVKALNEAVATFNSSLGNQYIDVPFWIEDETDSAKQDAEGEAPKSRKSAKGEKAAR